MLVMFMVQFPEIVPSKAANLNTPLTRQKACPLPASVLRKQAEALFLPKLFTTFILLEITGLLIKKILCSPYNSLDLKLKQANALDYFTVKG